MNSSVLKSILTNQKQIPSFMIFIENEPTNAKAYLNLIEKSLNKPLKFYDSADEALYDITTGLVDDRIYYILNDEKIIKQNNYIAELRSFNENIIVGFDGIKIPESFLNDNNNCIYVFDCGTLEVLSQYIQKKAVSNQLQLSNNDIIDLIQKSDYKLSQINNELEKIFLLDSDLRKEYIQTQQYPNIAKIDNMTVMLKVINKDMSVMQYISILIENAVGSLKAMYTMARKKFKTTNDLYYAKIMISSFKAFNSIIDGTMTSENAVKKFLIDLFS